MDRDLLRLSWPLERLGEALATLGQHSGLTAPALSEIASPTFDLNPGNGNELDPRLSRWFERAAAHLGLEAEPLQADYIDIEPMLRRAGPAVIRLMSLKKDSKNQPLPPRRGKVGMEVENRLSLAFNPHPNPPPAMGRKMGRGEGNADTFVDTEKAEWGSNLRFLLLLSGAKHRLRVLSPAQPVPIPR